MFKNITIYQLTATLAERLTSELPTVVENVPAQDPVATAWTKAGFAHPDQFGDSPVFESETGAVVFCVQIRERILPGKVIRTKLAEEVAAIEDRQGRKCGRKEIAGMKDELIARLLPSALIKHSDTLCMVVSDMLIVGSASARVVDTCLDVLRLAFDDALSDITFFDYKHRGAPLVSWMTEHILGKSSSLVFNVGRAVLLKGTSKEVSRFKNISLDSQAVRDSLADGQRPVELEFTFDGRVSFALTKQFLIKRLALLDVIFENYTEEDAASFDATVAITAGELKRLLATIVSDITAFRGDVDEDDEL